ncbi:BON domain-containing protein [Novipirellula artificiosorum]|uniref:BON domain protein n=1 Tax=Novipirellula artificiosorum TaxID=2528016 RepID=A0A5C6DFV0_9BACT|nr:BON domain-containing protein [Novipirellula artificiosorum]TWU36153.1 BON domain protein [Novipirellula artificiosorum]
MLAESTIAAISSVSSQRQALVRAALSRTSHQELSQIDASIVGDDVLLRGQLSSFYLKQVAQEVVRQTGVAKRVRNQIVVHPR